MLPGPVFNVELLTLARRRRYYALRFGYGLILLWMVWLYNPALRYPYNTRDSGEMTIQEMSELAGAIFSSFQAVQGIAVLVITPAMVAGVIADERQRKTLHYLLSSSLTSGEIVLGKLAARLLNLGVDVLLGLPVLSIVSLIGGIDPNEVLLFFLGLGSTAWFLGSLSILVSTYTRRPREAVTLTYSLEALWLFVPLIFTWAFAFPGTIWTRIYGWLSPVVEWVGWSSPLYMLMRSAMLGRATGAGWYQAVLWMAGLQLAFGTMMTTLAVVRLRPVFRKEGARPGWRGKAGRVAVRRIFPRPDCGDDAMLWKERHVSRSGMLTRIMMLMIVVGGLCTLTYFAYEPALESFHEVSRNGYGSTGDYSGRRWLHGYLMFVMTAIYVCMALGTASAASSSITSEREEDTWISLVATPLTPGEILRAKMIGTLWTMRWLALVMLFFGVMGVALGAVHPIGLVAEIVATSVFIFYAGALGTFFSLRARSSARALVATIGVMILTNGGYLMCCIPFRFFETMIVGFGVTPMVTSVALVDYEMIESLFDISNRLTTNRGMLETAVASFLSIGLYGMAAFFLTMSSYNRFDDLLDRPFTSGGVAPGRWTHALEGKEIRYVEIEGESDQTATARS